MSFLGKSSSSIPLFGEINDLHAAAGSRMRTDSPEFQILRLDELATARPSRLRHHRRGFFQLTYLLAPSGSEEGDLLFAAAPEHVLTGFEFGGETGFTLFFKAELLAHQLASPTNEFPFFCLPTPLRLRLERSERERLLPQFERLREAFGAKHVYRLRQLAALTSALLYDCRVLYEREHSTMAEPGLCRALICRFDEVVLQHFQTHRTVEGYARLLHVSADHLSAEVKAHTGRNARDIIAERIVTEAKHLLTYSELSVSEVADRVGFDEPTHFARFFKRVAGVTPLEFRRGEAVSPARYREAGVLAGASGAS